MTGKITSSKGFYIGDICYALPTQTYDDVWGGAGFEDGVYEVPGTGMSFAVASTKWGDGEFEDQEGREYPVDAGNIGIIPFELMDGTDGGHYFEGAGTATFEADGGMFDIQLPDGTTIHIDTDDSRW